MQSTNAYQHPPNGFFPWCMLMCTTLSSSAAFPFSSKYYEFSFLSLVCSLTRERGKNINLTNHTVGPLKDERETPEKEETCKMFEDSKWLLICWKKHFIAPISAPFNVLQCQVPQVFSLQEVAEPLKRHSLAPFCPTDDKRMRDKRWTDDPKPPGDKKPKCNGAINECRQPVGSDLIDSKLWFRVSKLPVDEIRMLIQPLAFLRWLVKIIDYHSGQYNL
ncbi:hypothetical protein ACFE04_000005 [Oxalis oulophora]